MNQYLIMGKLDGSFGGTERYDVVFEQDEDSASVSAWRLAKEVYKDYEGSYGLLDRSECESDEEYGDEIESWIEYEVIKEVDGDFDLNEYEESL